MDLQALLPEIEAAAVRGWPALETAEVDGWLWRHASGGSVRANSVAALRFTGNNPDTSVDRIEDLARSRGVPACFTVSDVSQPGDLDARLAARGYVRGADHVTMAKRVDRATLLPDAISMAPVPSSGWLKAYLSGLSADRHSVAPEILKRLPASALYIGLRGQGRVISSGLTIPDGNLASIQCMATLPDAQRQGGAAGVLQAIEHCAAHNGQTALYLQTDAGNAAAQALYRRAGFIIIGHYHTRTKVV